MSHIQTLYKEFQCSHALSFAGHRQLVNYHQESFHQINYLGSDSPSLDQLWLLNCVELNNLLGSSRTLLC
ncbi:rCG63513 [Rattus norvegicus]|uniref:RCG63513 n=1 Tax=Rattus norvegicus TaxID=10116 RepID=A6HIB9_RAT|nr:rCG63513 [Rattus norvegicus]